MSLRKLLVALFAALPSCFVLTSTDDLSSSAGGTDEGGADMSDVAADAVGADVAASTDGGNDGAAADGAPGDAGPDSPVSAYRAAVLADAPIGYFRFEETAGAGCANDIALSPLTCALSPTGLTRGVAGVASSAGLRIDDSGGKISMAAASVDLGKPYSVELWIEVDAPSKGLTLLTCEQSVPSRSGLIAFLFDAREFRTEVWNGGAFATYTLAATALTGNAWHHLVFGHDANGFDFAYVDGVASGGGKPYLDAGNPTVTVPITIQGWTGTVDEIAIYDKALPANRALAHYGLR